MRGEGRFPQNHHLEAIKPCSVATALYRVMVRELVMSTGLESSSLNFYDFFFKVNNISNLSKANEASQQFFFNV